MVHVQAPHIIDALGFIVGGVALALAFILQMSVETVITDKNGQTPWWVPAIFVGIGTAMMLMHAEPFARPAGVVVLYRLIAIFLVLFAVTGGAGVLIWGVDFLRWVKLYPPKGWPQGDTTAQAQAQAQEQAADDHDARSEADANGDPAAEDAATPQHER